MVKVRINDRESVQEAVRRFRKLVDRAGIKREMRRRAFFEKPSDARRREKIRSRFREQIHQQQSR